MLSCPSCCRLIHADRLKALAENAENAEQDDDPSLALSYWQEAIRLLPGGTRQYALLGKPSDRPNHGALVHYIALVAALSLLSFAPALRIR